MSDTDDKKDANDKRELLGLDQDEPLPKFGKRAVRPPVTEEEKRERLMEEFRNQARADLQEGRQRDVEDVLDAKTSGRKASLFRFGRSRSDADETPEPELSEEDEWHRRMSRQPDSGPEDEGSD